MRPFQTNKVIAVIGSRRRASPLDFAKCREEVFSIFDKGDKIVSGGCPTGGDRFAEIIAEELGLTEENGGLIIHRPQYPKNCTYFQACKALKDRNTIVANDCDVMIALVAEDRKGGTEDTIKKAKSKEVIII